ncbi:MAG: hypothetical protein UCO57_14260 [Gemmiger sp.]|uniref:hypothetical protein n=1 Tax=Gemmiger sp. TaxID=2049027 RepID=UPI002E763E3E|nr:hypothetical protein [Gemmiger sp.]MEE0709927.1 hypothetical protein [Gemmiger sp.]
MSPTISYTTTYRGQANDKCTLHILSLDLDFLDTVQTWIYDHAADTLTAGFSRGSMRGTDFSDKGRYSLSISCAQNKKGMAAKAALIEQFFTGGRVRKDMTLAQEKAHILAAIQCGKEQAQRKDQPMKKQNDRCPLQQECERTCKVVGHERDCDYYVNNRYSTGGIPDQDEILDDEEAARLEEIEKGAPSDLSTAPSDPVIYQNEYSTLFAVREHKGAPALMCKPLASDAWTLSGVLAAVQGEAYTAEDLQEVLDDYARAHGWKKAAREAPENPTAAAPASPADAGAAAQSLCAAEPASLEAKDMNVPAFDFSALGDLAGQAAEADEQFNLHYGRAQDEFLVACIYMARIHALTAKAGRYGGGTWTSWYQSKGISEGSARTMVQNGDGFKSATAADLKNLPALRKKDINLIARQGAAEQVLEAAGQGDSARIQEIMAEIRARDAKIKDLLEISEASDRRADEEERKRKEANEARIAAENKVQQYREIKDAALETAKQQREKTAAAESRARAAENRAAGAQKLAEQRGTENTELKAKIRELENQPRDVAVVQPGEEQIEAWRREGADRMAATMQETVRRANQEKLNAQSQVADLQQQLATARPDADACQRTADTLYETAENLRILLRTQLKQAQLSPTDYGKVVAHVLQVARTLLDTVRVCAPDGYDMDSEEDDDFE